MKNPKTIFFLVIILLLAGLAFVGYQYISLQQELQQTKAQLQAQQTNDRVLAFTRLFVEKVLQTDAEIDFETRLQLENAVRAIGDEQILAQWRRFTESVSESQAQAEVKNLLSLLIKKVEM